MHLQETDVDENAFEHCSFIRNNFNIIPNNSLTGYGTASLVKNTLTVGNIKVDTEGRIIVFDIDKCCKLIAMVHNLKSTAGWDSYSIIH